MSRVSGAEWENAEKEQPSSTFRDCLDVLRNPRLSHFFVYCSGVRCPKYQTILGAMVAKSMIGLPIDARGF
jgi:hypothetical protein